MTMEPVAALNPIQEATARTLTSAMTAHATATGVSVSMDPANATLDFQGLPATPKTFASTLTARTEALAEMAMTATSATVPRDILEKPAVTLTPATTQLATVWEESASTGYVSAIQAIQDHSVTLKTTAMASTARMVGTVQMDQIATVNQDFLERPAKILMDASMPPAATMEPATVRMGPATAIKATLGNTVNIRTAVTGSTAAMAETAQMVYAIAYQGTQGWTATTMTSASATIATPMVDIATGAIMGHASATMVILERTARFSTSVTT